MTDGSNGRDDRGSYGSRHFNICLIHFRNTFGLLQSTIECNRYNVFLDDNASKHQQANIRYRQIITDSYE